MMQDETVREAVRKERERCARLAEAAAERFPDNPQLASVLIALAEDIREE